MPSRTPFAVHPVRGGGRLPFEAHRAVEYLLGLTLVSVGVSLGELTIAAAGVVVVVPALTTRGRLGVVRWWSPAVHRLFDVAVVAALVLIAATTGSRAVLVGAILLPCAAVLALLMLRSEYRPGPVTQRAAAMPDQSQFDAAARRLGELTGRAIKAAEATERPSIPGDAPERVGRTAGRLVGMARSRMRRRRGPRDS